MTSRQIRRAFSVAILAVALVTTAAACSNDDGTTGNSGATTTRGQTATAELPDDVNDADVAFVQGMVPHHEQAIQMSELVIANGDDPTVIALAEQINAAQGPEIDQMNTWLDDWDIDPAGSDGMDGMDGANGMMSDDEMDMMSEAMGADLDRMFLETNDPTPPRGDPDGGGRTRGGLERRRPRARPRDHRRPTGRDRPDAVDARRHLTHSCGAVNGDRPV